MHSVFKSKSVIFKHVICCLGDNGLFIKRRAIANLYGPDGGNLYYLEYQDMRGRWIPKSYLDMILAVGASTNSLPELRGGI